MGPTILCGWVIKCFKYSISNNFLTIFFFRCALECMELCLHILFGVRCSGIWAVCRSTRCVKEFLSLNPLAFTHVTPELTDLKLIPRNLCLATYKEQLLRRNKYNTKWHLVGFLFHIMFGNSVWHSFLQIYGFISVKKFATFSNVVGVSFARKFKLNFRER